MVGSLKLEVVVLQGVILYIIRISEIPRVNGTTFWMGCHTYI